MRLRILLMTIVAVIGLFMTTLFLEGLSLEEVRAQESSPQSPLGAPFWSEDFSAPLQTENYYITATQGSGVQTASDAFLLTEAHTGERGRIFYSAPAWMDNFTADFKIYLGLYAEGAPVADGIAFIFCPSYDYAPSLGYFLDASCPGGYIIAFDTYENNSEKLFVAFENTNNRVCQSSNLIPGFFANGDWHDIAATFDHGKVMVSVDGKTPWTCNIPGYQPFMGYFGFSAATGGFYANQQVDEISIEAHLRRIFFPFIIR